MKELGFSEDPSKFSLSNQIKDSSHFHLDLVNEEFNCNHLKPEPIDKLNKKFSNQSSNQFSNQFSKQTSLDYRIDEQSKQQSINHQFNEQINKNLQTSETEMANNTSTVLNDSRNSSTTDKLNTHLDKSFSKFRIIPEVHILDLSAQGAIKPHVDSVMYISIMIAHSF